MHKNMKKERKEGRRRKRAKEKGERVRKGVKEVGCKEDIIKKKEN